MRVLLADEVDQRVPKQVVRSPAGARGRSGVQERRAAAPLERSRDDRSDRAAGSARPRLRRPPRRHHVHDGRRLGRGAAGQHRRRAAPSRSAAGRRSIPKAPPGLTVSTRSTTTRSGRTRRASSSSSTRGGAPLISAGSRSCSSTVSRLPSTGGSRSAAPSSPASSTSSRSTPRTARPTASRCSTRRPGRARRALLRGSDRAGADRLVRLQPRRGNGAAAVGRGLRRGRPARSCGCRTDPTPTTPTPTGRSPRGRRREPNLAG